MTLNEIYEMIESLPVGISSYIDEEGNLVMTIDKEDIEEWRSAKARIGTRKGPKDRYLYL